MIQSTIEEKTAPKPCKAEKGKLKGALGFVKDENILSYYLNEIQGAKSLTLKEEKELSLRIHRGDMKAMQILVQSNLRFVVMVCHNYKNRGLPFADLISEGNLGLVRAAKRFDGSLNFKFISYAVWWIRQAILTALAEQSHTMNIPVSQIGALGEIGKASQKLEQRLGCRPRIEDISKEIGCNPNEIVRCIHLGLSALSLNDTGPGEEGKSIEDCLIDKSESSPDAASKQYLLRQNLNGVLETLDEREEKVLRLYFGVGPETSFTLEEIGTLFNLTRERVRQIKEKAMRKLRHPARRRLLEGLRE